MTSLTTPSLFVAIDLEFNQPSGTLIQVGAVVGDTHSGSVIDRFCELCNPGEPLEPRIAKLCHIDPLELQQARPLPEVFESFTHWLNPYNGQRHLNPLTWGGADGHSLCEHAQREPGALFGRRWLDVKTLYTGYAMAQGQKGFGGLASALKVVGLRFQGQKHNAADDAANTFHMFCRLLALMRRDA